MKKIFYIIITAACFALFLSACGKKSADYYSFVSEERESVYLYEDDELQVKIYFSRRESPYKSDGIKGAMNDIIEAFVVLNAVCDEVDIAFEGYEGEMNYLAVSKSYYLSFSGKNITCDRLPVTLKADGKVYNLSAANVYCDGNISGRTALKCVTEYDKKLFDSLTDGTNFDGEIYIRLLYDEGCYYYVGVCDRNGKINAYLVDASDGRIIATRQM